MLDVSMTKRVNFMLSYCMKPQTKMCLASSSCLQQEIFGGRNFHGKKFCELVFDCENRENFCVTKFSHYTVVWLLCQDSHQTSCLSTVKWSRSCLQCGKVFFFFNYCGEVYKYQNNYQNDCQNDWPARGIIV